MEFHNDYLQENLKYFSPEKLIGLDYLTLTLTVTEGETESALH